MEARQTLGASASANVLRILLSVSVAIALVAGFAVVSSAIGASRDSGTTVVHPAPGTVLRQDNPAISAEHPAAGTVLRQDNPVFATTDRSIYVQGGRPQSVYDAIAAAELRSIYVQGGRPQAVYDEIARLEHH